MDMLVCFGFGMYRMSRPVFSRAETKTSFARSETAALVDSDCIGIWNVGCTVFRERSDVGGGGLCGRLTGKKCLAVRRVLHLEFFLFILVYAMSLNLRKVGVFTDCN